MHLVIQIGIDSDYAPMPLRQRVWQRLAGDMKPAHLSVMTRSIPFAELPQVFPGFIEGKARGRIVVEVGG